MTQVHLIVVDDQLDDRKSFYKNTIDQLNKQLKGRWVFRPSFCGSLGDFVALLETQEPVLCIVDLVLENGWSHRDVTKLDKDLLGRRWPLILLSAKLGEREAINRINDLLTENSGVLAQFVSWTELASAGEDGGVDKAEELAVLFEITLKRHGMLDISFTKEVGEDVDLLHLTDTHFGKADWNAGLILSLRTERERAGLGPADFLAITGDIANTGHPDEYRAARLYLDSLAKNGLVACYQNQARPERVFICPGNHDFNRPLALSSNIALATPSAREGEPKHSFEIRAQAVPGQEWTGQQAWCAYTQFARKLSGRSADWIREPGFDLSTRFQHVGLLILELNVEFFSLEGYVDGISMDSISISITQAVEACDQARKNGECVVVLVHRHVRTEWDPLGRLIGNAMVGLTGGGAVILLCGHVHENSVTAEYNQGVLVIRGPPSVPGPGTPPATTPSVRQLSFHRLDGRVTGVTVTQFSQLSHNWVAPKNAIRRFDWDPERNLWRNV